MLKQKILVIVAHPDDETIWMGGLLLKHKVNWDVTIISLCRKEDKDRAPKFKKVCELYCARGFISDLDDESVKPVKSSEIIKRVIEFLGKNANKTYDFIFTHGLNGEYGHIRHKEVHKAVKEMINKRLLKCDQLVLFSYLKKENDHQGYCICNSNATKLINLNEVEFLKKKRIITDVYGFEKGGFEETSSNKKESFDIINKNEMCSSLSLSC